MAIKKSELYSTLWKSCDELRGGMDASQYKDYVLVLLFMKYVSDRAKNDDDSVLDIPVGGSFSDLVKLKGKANIGEGINKVIGKLADANNLRGVIDVAEFNDDTKLGKGKDMVDRLSNLVGIFENPALDFASNSADGDDLLGDAYEYLMRNFATESGKSKGQFYTPAEVSRIMAAVIGIDKAKSQKETIYDPTCGSGSLLLKAHDAAKNATGFDLAIYGQEMENATAALARMNMWLHDAPGAEIKNNNTLSTPEFTDDKTGGLKTFDYVVANPPFSTKSWTTGVNANADPYGRFALGIPPRKNGDYAFLLHILASLKSSGKGAVILPHGVLFRGNSEGTIRRNVVERGYIKGIIGLPPNLFYGTGIPACIVVIDKEGASERKGIFMIDASKGFTKDGPKNRLRERDIHKIIDIFTNRIEVEKFSRMVPITEIADAKNGYNLNLPRYIDTAEPEDLHDIDAHLNGGIPNRDIDALDEFWEFFPKLRKSLFTSAGRDNYCNLTISPSEIGKTITTSDEYASLSAQIHKRLEAWTAQARGAMLAIDRNTRPKEFIHNLSESLLAAFDGAPLVDPYGVYQGLMEFWETTMKDDVYLVSESDWLGAAKPVKVDSKNNDRVDFMVKKDKFKSELLPSDLVIGRNFAPEQAAVLDAEADIAATDVKLDEVFEEHGGDDGLLSDLFGDKTRIARKTVVDHLMENEIEANEKAILMPYLALLDEETEMKKKAKEAEVVLQVKLATKYGTLNENSVIDLAVEQKWIHTIRGSVELAVGLTVRVFSNRLSLLADRYSLRLRDLEQRSWSMRELVAAHLRKLEEA